MRIITTIAVLLLFVSELIAQESKTEVVGTVSYVTAQNIYVRFNSTIGIKTGDKIYTRRNDLLIPVLIVDNVSSVSCVGKSVFPDKILTGEKVIALITSKDAAAIIEENRQTNQPMTADSTSKAATGVKAVGLLQRQRISGRIQVSSYSNFSNLPSGNSNRLRYLWSMDAVNIGNSNFSFQSYISFAHQLKNWAPVRENIFNALKIYDFNVKYEAGAHNILWLGRKVNPKIASIGAIDGLQYEMNLKHFSWGVVAGFRPDYTDYSFNAKLLEYGAFLGHNSANKHGSMQTSLAGFNQTNGGKTDRRFLYLQHDNSLLKNLNLFFSSEIDLYKVVNGLPVNEVSLTSLYLMLNYRISGKISLSGSYDNRKNIIYYETYKNYIDRMLADATRQGVQLRINIRPIPYLNVGLSGSYWDRAGDSKPTNNYNGYLTYTQLPILKATISGTVNSLKTSYVDGMIYGTRIDKDFFSGKLNCGMNYRYVDYTYLISAGKLLEQIGELDLSLQLTRKLSLSVTYEGTFDQQNTYHQIYGSLIKRF